MAKDPENELLWKFSRRRLEAEEIRDSMLAVSGRLNPKTGGPSVMVPIEPELIKMLKRPQYWVPTRDKTEHDRRTLYMIYKRNLRLPFMEVFDAPDMLLSCARREQSTHAPQALELLNGETVERPGRGVRAAAAEGAQDRGRARSTMPGGWRPAARPMPRNRRSPEVSWRRAGRSDSGEGVRAGDVQLQRFPVRELITCLNIFDTPEIAASF